MEPIEDSYTLPNNSAEQRNKDLMALNPDIDFYDSEGNLVRPSRISALEARVKEQQEQIDKLTSAFNQMLSECRSHYHEEKSEYGYESARVVGFEGINEL